MRLSELSDSFGLTLLNASAELEITDISTHTCRVTEGTLFVPLEGKRYDGNKFISAAKELGAVAVLAKKGSEIIDGIAYLLADDPVNVLPKMLSKLYNEAEKKIITVGITGTKGKSSTLEFLSEVLSSIGYRCASISTFGIRIAGGAYLPTDNTTPPIDLIYKSLDRAVKEKCDFALIELSSQALATGRVRGISFPYSVFTGISEDHIGVSEHASFNDYFNAKRRLFEEHGVKCAVVNSDDPAFLAMVKGISRTARVGRGPNVEYRIDDVVSDLFKTEFTLNKVKITLSIGGAYNAINASLAIALASVLTGRDIAALSPYLRGVRPKGRFEVYSLENRYVIIDFAHNESSFRAVLSSVRDVAKERLIALFGSVGSRCKDRRAALARISEEYADVSVITSDDPGQEDAVLICKEIYEEYADKDRAVIITDRAEAIRYALDISARGDVILLLGKGHERHQTVGNERIPFSEQELITSLGAVRVYDSDLVLE